MSSPKPPLAHAWRSSIAAPRTTTAEPVNSPWYGATAAMDMPKASFHGPFPYSHLRGSFVPSLLYFTLPQATRMMALSQPWAAG
eukprot:3622009-Prymnesium_polylepis.2